MYNYLIAFVYKLILLIGNLDSFMMYELFNYTFFIFFFNKKSLYNVYTWFWKRTVFSLYHCFNISLNTFRMYIYIQLNHLIFKMNTIARCEHCSVNQIYNLYNLCRRRHSLLQQTTFEGLFIVLLCNFQKKSHWSELSYIIIVFYYK